MIHQLWNVLATKVLIDGYDHEVGLAPYQAGPLRLMLITHLWGPGPASGRTQPNYIQSQSEWH